MDPCPCRPLAEETTSTLYPKIGKLSDVVYKARNLKESSFDLVGTVKLHGTHADIVIDDNDRIRLQSRNQTDLQPAKDNCGFATFADPLKQDILALRNAFVARYRTLNPNIPLVPELPVVIAGEWCGGSIQKKVALLQLTKQFVIVSVKINDTWLPDTEYGDIHNESIGIYNIARAGFFQSNLDLQKVDKLDAEIKTLVEQVEKECPYARTFGVSGIGEGIVWKLCDYFNNPDFWFKSKGEMFAVSACNKLPESALGAKSSERLKSFAKAIVTENRMQQGWGYLEEMRVARDMTGLGKFLRWVVEDCLKEEQRDMEEANIREPDLKPAIIDIAKLWYKGKVNSNMKETAGDNN